MPRRAGALNHLAVARVSHRVHPLSLVVSLLLAPPSPRAAFAEDVGVRWRLGPADGQGAQERLGLELFARDGQAIWFTPLPADELARQVALAPAEALENHVRLHPPEPWFDECVGRPTERELPRTLLTDIRAREVVIADARGVRAYARASGTPRAAWSASPRPARWPGSLDEPVEVLVFNRETHVTCGAEFDWRAPQTVALRCDDEVLLWFDGATISLHRLDPLTRIGQRRVDPRRVRSDDRSHFLRERFGVWVVELESPA